MEYRTLGKEGPSVSSIGLGTWPIGGGMGQVDEKMGIKIVRTAIEAGITFIDTAEAYLNSEEIVGKALKDGYREKCVLATKASRDFSRNGITGALEASLRKLGTEYIDLYQIHRWDPDYRVEESIETLVELRNQGKIRYFGVSNYNVEQLQQAMDVSFIQSNQVRYSMFDRQIEGDIVPFCESNGIGILAHSPLSKGLLTNKYKKGYVFSDDDERSVFPRFQGEVFNKYLELAHKLNTIAASRNVSLVQLAVSWTLRIETISSVLVGVKNLNQLDDTIKADAITISEEENAEIRKVLQKAPPTDSYGPFTEESFAI